MLKKWLAVVAVFTSLFALSGCGYNTMQSQDEAANAAWSEVLNQYQRRADLIPNLVNTVKGYATHEQEVFTQVTEARSKVGSIQMSAEDAADPEKLQQFQQAQGNLSSALSRLLVVSENYPQLKADQNFPRFTGAALRARKTAFRWRATTTSRLCKRITPPCASFRKTSPPSFSA